MQACGLDLEAPRATSRDREDASSAGSLLSGHLSNTDAPWSPQGPALATLGVFPPCFEGLGGTRGQSAQARVAGSCPWSPETSASDGHNQCPTAPCPGTSAVGQVGEAHPAAGQAEVPSSVLLPAHLCPGWATKSSQVLFSEPLPGAGSWVPPGPSSSLAHRWSQGHHSDPSVTPATQSGFLKRRPDRVTYLLFKNP